MQILTTNNPELQLVLPDPDRDTPFAMEWFAGEAGKRTLQLMGNAEPEITPTSYEKEHEIISEFLELEEEGKQLTWAMRYQEKTIGAVWIELEDKDTIPAPAISIMIGDISARGQGIGHTTMVAVLNFLKSQADYKKIYARHLVNNNASKQLL